MADEQNGDQIAENKKGSSTTPDEGKPTSESKTEEWQEMVGDKFKSPSELAKSYKELEKKYGSQSEEVKQAREFIQASVPVFEVIKNDPELFKALEAKLVKQTDTATPANDKAKVEEDTQGVRDITSDLLIARFEDKHGINKLEPEEAKDLRRLGTTLENAYIIAKYKSKSAASSSETEDRASISSVPGSPGKGETVLTPEEAKVAEKMGLTREQYLAGKK